MGKQSCLSKTARSGQPPFPSAPAPAPTPPCTPLHGCILVNCSGLLLLVSLVLLRSTDVGLVMCRVRENVIGSPVSVDHGYMARRKLLEFLLLRSRLGGDHLKAGCHQHALFVLRAACCRAAGGQR